MAELTLEEQLKNIKIKGEELQKKVGILAKAKKQGLKITPQTTVQQAQTFIADTSEAEPPPTMDMTPPPEMESIAKEVENQRKALENAYKKQLDEANKELAKVQAKQEEFLTKQKETLKEAEPFTTPFRKDLETAERKRLKVEENFFANQQLTNELDRLLTESAELTRRLSEQQVPGLAGLQQSSRMINARETAQGRIAIIQAVMAARNNQIGTALNFIDRSINSITLDRQDRLNYLNNLFNWYETQRDEEGKKIFELTTEQKRIINNQIKLLENDLKRTQAIKDKITSLMTDPETAQMVADAGITLNDSVQEIEEKMAKQARLKQIQDTKNSLIKEGYEYIPMPTEEEKENLVPFEIGGQTLYFRKPIKIDRTIDLGDRVVGLDEKGNIITSFKKTTTEQIKSQLREQEWFQAEKFIEENPDATSEELEAALRRDAEHLTDSDIKAIIEAKKGREISTSQINELVFNMTMAQVDNYFRARYTTDELKQFAREAGFEGGGFLGIGVGEAGIKDYLASPKAREKLSELLTESYKAAGYTIKTPTK